VVGREIQRLVKGAEKMIQTIDLILHIVIIVLQIIIHIEYCKLDKKTNDMEKELDSLWLDDQGDYEYWENEDESGEWFKD
jgi:hypothetical protein